jgi:hypothetical protein
MTQAKFQKISDKAIKVYFIVFAFALISTLAYCIIKQNISSKFEILFGVSYMVGLIVPLMVYALAQKLFARG